MTRQSALRAVWLGRRRPISCATYVLENDLPQMEQRCGFEVVSAGGTGLSVPLHARPGWGSAPTRTNVAGQVVQPTIVALAGPALEQPRFVGGRRRAVVPPRGSDAAHDFG